MIKDILKDELVVTEANPLNWREAAKLAGNLLVDSGKVKQAFVDSMIATVEQYGPYMILVPKVCFFHGVPGPNVKEPCLSLVVFEKPVYFDDFDNQQINCCFAFGATDNESHMEMIKNVAFILQDHTFIEMITNNASKTEIMQVIKKY